jgi:hypothetical protein
MSGKDDALNIIDNLLLRAETISSMLYSQNEKEAMEKLAFFMEDITVLVEWLLSNQYEKEDSVFALNNELRQIVSAFERKDPFLAADILNANIVMLLQDWEGNLRERTN